MNPAVERLRMRAATTGRTRQRPEAGRHAPQALPVDFAVGYGFGRRFAVSPFLVWRKQSFMRD